MGKLHARLGIFGTAPIGIMKDKNVKPNAFKVYVAISSFQGNNDKAFPGREKIAERAGLSERACSDAITNLVETGWIARQRRYGKSSVYECLVYLDPVVQVSTCAENHPDECAENHPDECAENHPNIKDQLKDQFKRPILVKSLTFTQSVEKHWNALYKENMDGLEYFDAGADRAMAKKLKISERYEAEKVCTMMDEYWQIRGTLPEQEKKYYPALLRSFYKKMPQLTGAITAKSDAEIINSL